jgi:hypothetical protein
MPDTYPGGPRAVRLILAAGVPHLPVPPLVRGSEEGPWAAARFRDSRGVIPAKRPCLALGNSRRDGPLCRGPRGRQTRRALGGAGSGDVAQYSINDSCRHHGHDRVADLDLVAFPQQLG